MKGNRHSSTAEATAAVRAWHRLNHDPLVFDDPYALEFTSRLWRAICRNRLLTWLIFEKILKQLQPVAAEILIRARYTEDKLEAAIQRSTGQYVLLGAGFDTFALRRPDLLESIYVYEVDHPHSQRVKKERILKLHGRLPANLDFIPVDFEKQTLADALGQSGYRKDKPAFFSLLGVVQYLTRETVLDTLASLASLTAAGSELVFDYLVTERDLGTRELATLQALRKFTQRRGEPLASGFNPAELEHDVAKRGFEVVENMSPAQLALRYPAAGNNKLRLFDGNYIMHVRRTAD